jgi:ATP-dependent exoDNAse (exonuclease V) beta subunit
MSDNLLVYKSSAGSGKTTQLVIEYLKLVIPHPEKYHAILAITFTNKATEEMKSRIIDTLDSLQSGKETPPYKSILLNAGLDEKKIQQAAGTVLRLILHDYSRFAVSTIDAFMHRIIRSFAFDLHLSQSFEVILDQEEEMQRAVDMMLDGLEEKDTLTGFLVSYINNQLEESRSWRIEPTLYKFAKVLENEDAASNIRRIENVSLQDFITIEKQLKKQLAIFETTLNKQNNYFEQLIGDIPETAFFQKNKGVPGYFKNIKTKAYQKKGLTSLEPNTYVWKFMEEGKFCSGQATANEKAAIENVADKISTLIQHTRAYAFEKGPDYFFYRIVLRHIHGLAVLKEIAINLNALKKEFDYVHISEFNRRIADEIRQAGSVPYLFERLGEQYQHIFIDEFQDTSLLQWHNLLPLVTNGLSSGNKSMIVGDGKQAIYRWRNGEVTQFAELPSIYQKELLPDGDLQEQILSQHFREQTLKVNRRSLHEIVDFNNRFFEFVKNQMETPVHNIYAGHQQKESYPDGGYVQITFVEGRKKEALEPGNFDTILNAIHTALEAGYRKRDIAILNRLNEESTKIANFLTEKGLEVLSTESLLLTQSAEIHFLMAVFTFLDNPKNMTAFTEIASWIKRNQPERWPDLVFHDIITQYQQNENSQNHLTSEAYQQVLKWSNLQPGDMETHSIYSLAEKIIRQFNLDQMADPYLVFFLEEILNNNLNDFQTLKDWWEKNKAKKSIAVSDETNAVRIMTIHKSKGLQFPVVIVPFLTARGRSKTTLSNLWLTPGANHHALHGLERVYVPSEKKMMDTTFKEVYEDENRKSMLDDINVLYVAFTRAEEQLVLIADMPGEKTANQSPAALLRQFLDSEKYWNQEQNTYLFGTPKAPIKTSRSVGKVQILPHIKSEPWQNKVRIAKDSYMSEQMVFGTMIHETLARIKTAEDIPTGMQYLSSQQSVKPATVEIIRKQLKALVAHPELKQFFDNSLKILTEQDILHPDGTLLRPDRMVFKDTKASVIEYKTGQAETAHKKQIEQYAATLKAAGYEVENRILVYIHENEPIRIEKY